MKRYNPSQIEPKWQKIWQKEQTYKAKDNNSKPKYYALSMFPYPSGIGLHIGHVRNFTITDAVARFMKMQGHEVLHPMGWDSFGLPAENYAIITGTPPQVTTKQNTDNFRVQAQHLGLSIDWSREFGSTDPQYYKWTQWFFLLLYKRGLAYQKESAQFWCIKCKTVLANEQVVNGCCWRHDDTPVTKKTLKQWFFKITDYAERLGADLEDLDWPESIKTMQRNWIGRSKGAEVDFAIESSSHKLTVFTTRPDTLFGATFMVVAPEHPIVGKITASEYKKNVKEYIGQAQSKTDIDRMDENREKTGVFTGAYAINPVSQAKIPVWVADYVLMGYGTGAIMAVPAHDERDHAFALKFNLPITEVIASEYGERAQDEQWADGATVLAYDKSTRKFLALDWGKWTGLVSGGLENGESHQDCARRELREEAGITAAELTPLGSQVFAHYHNKAKGINRFASTQGFLAFVDSGLAQKTAPEDHEKFSSIWLDPEELQKRLAKLDGGSHWEELLRRAIVLLKEGQANAISAQDLIHEGILINSGKYDGADTAAAREKITADLAKQGTGREVINYRMRDWLISRQRYWGAPIPMVHCKECGIVPVPEDQLPVELPELTDFEPSGDGRSPLAKVRSWVETTCPKCHGPAERETDTMDGFACSSWYFLRFADPHNSKQAFSKELAQKWLPVDMYIGGAEHAVMHLLYARMWTKVMFDAGLIGFNEPFKALRNQGLLLAPDGSKFSKSKGNGVDPEDIISSGYGADALRTTILFLAPFDQATPWSPEGLGGVYRFLNRFWTLAQEVAESKAGPAEIVSNDLPLKQAVHRTIKKVTRDMHKLGLNTAIAALMELINDLYKLRSDVPMDTYNPTWSWAVKVIARLVSPFAPHLAEEAWQQFGGQGSVTASQWPEWDESLTKTAELTIPVQVNGKLRATLHLPPAMSQEQIQAAALAEENVQKYLQGNQPKRVVYIPGKLVNFVIHN